MRQDKTPFEKDGKIFLQLDCENAKRFIREDMTGTCGGHALQILRR